MRYLLLRIFAGLLLVSLFLIRPEAARGATITVVNLDGPGEGFNDPSPPDPASTAGGNNGPTLGDQRLIAFQSAVNIWGGLLSSPVEIRIGANFDPLACTDVSAVLGRAGANTAHRDFAGAPLSNTWYPQALANSLAGVDLSPNVNDINAIFNSAIGTTCPFPIVWYYGLDGNPPGGLLDFVTVVLHELAHGLGFVSFVNLATGARLLELDDVFSRNLEDHSTATLYPEMTNAERVNASQNTGNLHWVGANVVAAGSRLIGGVHPSGHVQMFAPNPQQSGSSVSHFDTAATPDELMEPFYAGPKDNIGLTSELFRDLGWVITPPTVVSAVLPNSRSVLVDASAAAFATIINAGPGIAIECGIAPITTIPATFFYQATNPFTNQIIGTPNTPVSIAAGAAQSFVFAFTPTAPFAPTDVQLSIDCANSAPSSIITGLNTLLLSASATPVPDIVTLAATLNNDGIVNILRATGTGVFAAAIANVGVGGAITGSADTGAAALPVSISICETNPGTGACLASPASSVTTTINANATATFGIFVAGAGDVPFDPAANRIFVRFKDAGGVTRGSTSVAVRTQ
ncbi:MAG TPA: hypothetical protein VLD83_01905 [Candidatus Binatia bacterium]|nr:hypothetical protein [Candidatus Binatia bacterium]